ncbi:hypothetical protein SS05631_c40080 [Sinorhizobium sp. CCBAU 05631]|nr:hypothetical protein SS05631_c40080 [Sinorhizobium sp. CCBAU 05631]
MPVPAGVNARGSLMRKKNVAQRGTRSRLDHPFLLCPFRL